MLFHRSWLPWVLLALLAGAGGAWLARSLGQAPELASGTLLEPPRIIDRFELVDDAGRAFGNERLRGAPTLVYFGFTNCPDVCPTTLAILGAVLRAKPLPGLRVVFVTVDPERDDPAALHRYVTAFGRDFIGLTGPAPALLPITRSLIVAFERRPLPGGGYTMDHSSTVYLLDPQGRFAGVFTPPFKATAIAADLARLRARFAS